MSDVKLSWHQNPLPTPRGAVKINERVLDTATHEIGTFLGWDTDGDPAIQWDGYDDIDYPTYLGTLRPV